MINNRYPLTFWVDFDEDLFLVHWLDDLADIGALLLQMLQLFAQHSHLQVNELKIKVLKSGCYKKK